MSKFTDWYNSQPTHTKAYLNKQPIWHDRDMIKAFLLGNLIGIVFGFILALTI
jgi:hypothetical protein